MGSKDGGSSSPPPVVIPSQPNISDQFGPMMEMMQAQMGAIMAMAAQPPELPPIPESTLAQMPQIDWDKKRREELDKQRAIETDKAKRRKGISSTILTSPLLDEEEVDLLTSEILTSQ